MVAILFYLRNPTVVLMTFKHEFEGNLTIGAIHFSLREPTVVSKIFHPET